MSACVAFELCHPLLLCGNELREYTTQSGVRATARPPVCILQARGGGAIPEVALWTTERFVRVL